MNVIELFGETKRGLPNEIPTNYKEIKLFHLVFGEKAKSIEMPTIFVLVFRSINPEL